MGGMPDKVHPVEEFHQLPWEVIEQHSKGCGWNYELTSRTYGVPAIVTWEFFPGKPGVSQAHIWHVPKGFQKLLATIEGHAVSDLQKEFRRLIGVPDVDDD